MKKVIKYISIFLAVLLLLVVVLLLLTQTAFFREKLKDRLVVEAEKYMNLQIEIESLNGNLYRTFEMEDVTVTDSDSVIGRFASLRLNYSLLPLLSKEILVDSIVLDKPGIWIRQEKDSTWNFQSFLKVQQNEPDTIQKKSTKFRVQLNSVKLSNGNFELDALNKNIPRQVNNLNLLLEAAIDGPEIRANLKYLNFTSVEPNIVLNELSGIYAMDDTGILIDSVRIRTAQSAINMNGNYRELENMEADVNADPINNQELEIFMPKLKLLCTPQVKISTKTENDVLTARINLVNGLEEITAEVSLSSVTKLVEQKGPIPYLARLFFKEFSAENWIEIDGLESKLNGSVEVDGKDLLKPKASTHVNADLRKSSYNSVALETFAFKGNVQNDNVNGNLRLSSDFGTLAFKGKVLNLSSSQNYTLDILADNFNVTAFFPEIDRTVISGRINTKGHGFDFKKMSATADLDLSASQLYTYQVDKLSSALVWEGPNIQVDTIQIVASGAQASGKGSFNIDSLLLDTRLEAHIDSLSLVKHLVELPLTFDSVLTVSRIHGPVNQLKIEGEAEVFHAAGYGAVVDKTTADYRVDVHPDSLKVEVNAESSSLNYSGIDMDSAIVQMDYLNNHLGLSGRILVKDTIDVKFQTDMMLGDTMLFSVPQFEAKTLLSDYYLRDTLKAMLIGVSAAEIRDFELRDANDPGFKLDADGHFSMSDSNSFRMLINNLKLQQFNRFIQADDSINGVLNAEFVVNGTALNPNMEGEVEIVKPAYGAYSLSSVAGSFAYRDQKATAEIDIPDFAEAFHASVSTVFNAYLDSLKFVFSEPETFEAKFDVKNAKLSQHLKHVVENDSISGILNAELSANGNFDNPQIFGTLHLDDVRYENKNLGLDFQDLKTDVVFDGNKINIDTIYIRQPKGFVSISGDLEFDSTIVKGNIISSTLEADADNFLIAKNRSYEVLIDANTFLKTGKKNPEFGGKIKVLRSDVYLPAILTRDITDDEEDIPMLVEALDLAKDSTSIDSVTVIQAKKTAASIFDGITGRMNVEIPRNTWVRNNNMRVELSGDVDIVKTGPYFELFGEVKLIRGHYVLYGRKLNIKSSSIIFDGGEDFNPTLNFNAEYVFRSQDREKRYLDIMISGTLDEPDIAFMLDDVKVTENDGVSVLLFGSTADEIGFGQQNGLMQTIGSNAVASLITSQLSKTIGTQFNLDMIEVTATENWTSAAFVVGKYITNDIFVIYERGFGEVEGDEIVPETFTVEYELNDKLFLRLQSGSSISSGIDFILKFEQEDKK